MNFFSHLFISRELYKRFRSEIELNGWAFAFGNVKPDLPPACFEARHTFENYFNKVNERADQLATQQLTRREFSVKLGEVCHFACDFFCYYHSNVKLHKKNLFHFVYEICLQLQLNMMQLRRKLKIPCDSVSPYTNFPSFILEMRKKYLEDARSMKKDIEYSLRVAISIFETILQSVNNSLEEAWQLESTAPPLEIEEDNYESSVIY
jgi:hypothetical protein